MEDYFPTSEASSAWIQQPFIAEMNDNKQLNLHEQHLELQSSQAAKTKFSSSSLIERENVFRVVRFHTVTLFSFDFPSNFLKFSLATHYEQFFSPCLTYPGRLKKSLLFPQMFDLIPVAL